MYYFIIAIISFLIGYRIAAVINNEQELIELRKENKKLRYFLRQTKPKAR